MADNKTIVEEAPEEDKGDETTDETKDEGKDIEAKDDKSDDKKEKSEETEEKIDPIKEKKKTSQDRAWERVIEKNARMAAELDQIKQTLAQQQAQKTQQDAPTAPKREDYTEIGDYLEAKQDYNNLVLQNNMERRIAQIQQQTQPEATETSWDQAEEAARAKYADYDDVVEEAKDIMVPEVAIEAIRRSPIGPDLTYHLAKNPADAQKLSRMKVAGDQIFFLGQLAGRLTEAKTQKPIKKSAAPEPIKPTRTSGGQVETDRDKLSDSDWFALRAKEKQQLLRQRMGIKT